MVDILDGDETCCSLVAVENILSAGAWVKYFGLVFCLAGLVSLSVAINGFVVPVFLGYFCES